MLPINFINVYQTDKHSLVAMLESDDNLSVCRLADALDQYNDIHVRMLQHVYKTKLHYIFVKDTITADYFAAAIKESIFID